MYGFLHMSTLKQEPLPPQKKHNKYPQHVFLLNCTKFDTFEYFANKEQSCGAVKNTSLVCFEHCKRSTWPFFMYEMISLANSSREGESGRLISYVISELTTTHLLLSGVTRFLAAFYVCKMNATTPLEFVSHLFSIQSLSLSLISSEKHLIAKVSLAGKGWAVMRNYR